MSKKAYFQVEDTEPKSGAIILRDGTKIRAGQSKQMARYMLHWAAGPAGLVEPADVPNVKKGIRSSKLPLHLTLEDQRGIEQITKRQLNIK